MGGSNLHSGHRERMRIRFSADGFENYRPHEVLEQVLYSVIPRANTNETAHLLIEKFGSLSGVLNALPEELMRVHGIGKRAAEFIASIRTNFTAKLAEFYREQGEFGVYELAFLADLTLIGRKKCFLVTVFDENLRFLKMDFTDAVTGPDGCVNTYETAAEIVRISGSSPCIAVTADGSCLDDEEAENLFRAVHAMGGAMEQLLLTEDGALYSMIDMKNTNSEKSEEIQ